MKKSAAKKKKNTDGAVWRERQGVKLEWKENDKTRRVGAKMTWQQLEVKAAGLMRRESAGFYFAASGGRM